MRGRRNDTIETLHERLSGDSQEQACLCEAIAMTLHEGRLAIGKNRLVNARPWQ